MKRKTVKKETMAEEEKNAEKPAQPTHGSQEEDWAKTLGAVPADQYYEDSPEIARIEEMLSTSGETAAEPAKKGGPEDLRTEWTCNYLNAKMLVENIKSNKAILCPAKATLERAKIAFESTLTDEQKKMEVLANYLPCHICPKYYQVGKELPKGYKLRDEQMEFLQEFDLWEERPVSKQEYLHDTNSNRKRTARTLQTQKLIRTAARLLKNPTNPQKPEPTLIANLSVLGYIASGKDPGFIENNLSRVLLQKPIHVVALYVEKLRTEIEHLREFVKTRKQQRTPMGQLITVGIIELERQHDFILKYDALDAQLTPTTASK